MNDNIKEQLILYPQEITMSKDEALQAIKVLRDKINDTPDATEWANKVLYHLDQASDILEFPNAKGNEG